MPIRVFGAVADGVLDMDKRVDANYLMVKARWIIMCPLLWFIRICQI